MATSSSGGTSRKDYVLGIMAEYTDNAEQLLERLSDEGLLQLGYGNNEVEAILDRFKSTFGNTKTTQYDRFAAHRLADKYGSTVVCHVIELLGAKITEKYAPVPSSVANMEEKIVSILAFLRKQEDNEVI
jgi:hypothetical protein